MHQDIGLEAFNRLPYRKALHALYECCNSLAMATELVRERPYPDHAALFARADAVLFGLPEDSIDEIMQAYPSVGSRPGSAWSHAEQCSVWDSRPEVMDELRTAADEYSGHFGFGFVMHVGALAEDCPAPRSSRRSATGCTTTWRPNARWPATRSPNSTAAGWNGCWDPRAATTTGAEARSCRIGADSISPGTAGTSPGWRPWSGTTSAR